MLVKEISVSVKRIKNLGNYQSFTAEASVTAQVQEGGAVSTAFDEAWNIANAEVEEQIAKAK